MTNVMIFCKQNKFDFLEKYTSNQSFEEREWYGIVAFNIPLDTL